ncbi:t1pks [Neopestalotiopsis sp. 37M]|nr:t1pks [Neopestalotiopsis sp. 37M]
MNSFNEPIAIIGSGCRFPGGSSSPSKLWDLLKDPRDVGSKIDRFNADGWYHKNGNHHGTSNVRNAYLLKEDTRHFDAQFFNVPSSEAESMDPQQRFLLEVVYEALESAGQSMEALSGSSTSVYVGVMCNDFAHITYHDIDSLPKMAATGTALSILSNRVSYFFNWTGPSMTIDTACSSSLIATHQAVQSLRRGESRVAVAAGANLILGPTNFIAESNVNMLSPTGRSRMWDSGADGYARGEGVAAVILKRLTDAIADGDVIESIIRETGTNQDGRTPGITMPSSTSQAQLIRQTYANAGLSIDKDRCQYFEAHGTGTKAGDPQEAGAIYKAFFGDKAEENVEANNTLYVGSIKTIVGHTEGTAGLAGLLKASLAVQHGVIPPNMLFNELNPDITPYYGKLQIPTSATPWPELPAGTPRRVSVNSFGFGGANAHAIIESYEPATVPQVVEEQDTEIVGIPFAFSGNSEKTLATQLETCLSFLDNAGETLSLRDLAWTLSRRTAFTLRTVCSAQTSQALKDKLIAKLDAKRNDNKALGVRPAHKTSTILGVFTGQGAQAPQMAYGLIEASPFARNVLQKLDASLQSLPEPDRPVWSLIEELSRAPDSSRVMEAAFSQPLCTAVQIMLVDMAAQVGITFGAVVGHSSGEIAAAYAAGFLTASDAIRIAYYRGLYAKLARGGPKGLGGGMLAVGTSLEDGDELCELPTFEGRINVAASNSSASVTLSGDADAIDEAKFILEDEKKFVRALNVDTAYHSHHTLPCAEPYMDAMARIQVSVQQPDASCKWFSSVLRGQEVDSSMASQLAGSYWKDNLVQPVFFSQAIEKAVEAIGAPAMALELGPHPALKGPASLVMEEKCGSSVPYSSFLVRKTTDVEAFSEGVGSVWANVGANAVNIGKCDSLFSESAPKYLKDAPGYTWDHGQTFWTESRLSRTMRNRIDGHHELLGARLDSGENEFRWRNFIKPSEMPWIRGHQIQGQTIFPGAGFASMAIEACKVFGPSDEMVSIELVDLTIQRAMSFIDEAIGTECLVTLSNVQQDHERGLVTCRFVCQICPMKDSLPMVASTCQIRVQLGHGTKDLLPGRWQDAPKMTDVDCEIFYNSLAKLGYNYSDMFQGVTALRRNTELAAGVIHIPSEDEYKPDFILHPAPLDVAFQGIFGAIGAPGDGRLWTLMVPTVVNSIKINPSLSQKSACLRTDLPFDASIAISPSNDISGDVDVYDSDGETAILQIQGLHVTPVTQVTSKDDTQKICEAEWGHEKIDASRNFSRWWDDMAEEHAVAKFAEWACFFYMKHLHDTITVEERETLEGHPRRYLAWVDSVVAKVETGTHATLQKDLLDHQWSDMEAVMKEFASTHDEFHHVMTLGNSLVGFIRGEVDLSELDIPEEIHRSTFGVPEYTSHVGDLVQDLTHKLRQMDILEIGAGDGSTTQAIMSRIGDYYSSYTYTDLSADVFVDAEDLFSEHSEKFVYKTLDIQEDVATQGYLEQSYDLIVASEAMHKTQNIEETLSNVRKLLKPGGHLVMLEVTNTNPVRQSYFAGILPEWWLSNDEARPHHPLLNQSGWDVALRKTGFSGIDTSTPETHNLMVPLSIFITQAVDSQMNLIREPLLAKSSDVKLNDVMILAGESPSTTKLVDDITAMIKPLADNITMVNKLEDLSESHFTSKQIVLSLVELDELTFSPFTPEKWAAIQLLTSKVRNLLWVLQGASGEQPYHNMLVGVARCLVHEKPDIRFQLIDFDAKTAPDSQFITETLIRLHVSSTWKNLATPYEPSWVLEREVRYIDGEVFTPRCVPSYHLDARYNSTRRNIREDVPLDQSVVAITSQQAGFELEEVTVPAWTSTAKPRHGVVQIDVQHSSLLPVKVPSAGHLYLIVGKMTKSQQKVLAFSDSQQSKVSVPRHWSVPCDVPDSLNVSLLVAAQSVLLSDFVLSHTPKGFSTLVHEPTAMVAAAIETTAAQDDMTVIFTSSVKTSRATASVKHIHPSAHDRTLWNVLPKHLSSYIDMSGTYDSGRVGARLQSHLPSTCRVMQLGDFIGGTAYSSSEADCRTITHLLNQAIVLLERHSDLDATERVNLIGLGDVPKQAGQAVTRNDEFHFHAVDWTREPAVSVKLSPLENEVRFRPDKTYWLAGLTGELGLSLTKWMVNRGARYVVMTSRKPKVDEQWLERVQSDGAVVKMMAMDITDLSSVTETYETICSTMPEIAGVCNGAMVLNDGLIEKQSYEDFNGTLRPKVDGTRFLNDLFDKPTLDFFIVFSSLAYSTGNIGQSSYAAANAFMVSTVEGRRKRGLAGSAINMAGIYGIGYITRQEATLMDRLEKIGYSNISEWDYLQLFGAAVLASPVDSTIAFEISSSVRPSDPDAETPPPWLDVPRFSYYRRVRSKMASDNNGETLTVRAQLREQTTMAGVEQVLLAGLVGTLNKLLGLRPEDNAISPATSLIEVGIDSLVAVDMRFWFTRELDLDLPVLKLLGGATVEDMVEDAMARLSPELIPNVKVEESAAAPVSENEVQRLGEQKDADRDDDTSSESIDSTDDEVAGASTPNTGIDSSASSVKADQD